MKTMNRIITLSVLLTIVSVLLIFSIISFTLIGSHSSGHSATNNAYGRLLLADFDANMQNYFIISLVVGATVLLFSSLLTRKMAWRVLRPLQELSQGAHRIENGDLSVPVIHKGKDEFAEVVEVFNRMQQSLLDERNKKASYEKAREDLIAGISHDLRTPLTSVKGYIKGLKDGVADTPEKREQYLSIAYKKACDIDLLLQKLFYVSNLEAGNFPLSLMHLDLGDFVRDYAEDAQEELARKQITLVVEIDPARHFVKIDEGQMRRVLDNLVENAIKYANVTPLMLRIAVDYDHLGMEHLTFSDNGQGVPDSCLSQIFEQFWRLDESRHVKGGYGSGLGLYIVKYIVEAHGGNVSAKNNNGLEIKIFLPHAFKE